MFTSIANKSLYYQNSLALQHDFAYFLGSSYFTVNILPSEYFAIKHFDDFLKM